jgi:hypothetical protein
MRNESKAMDPQIAAHAFERWLPRLEEIRDEDLVTVNVDLQRVAITAAAVGRDVLEPDNRARFASLPAHELDIRNVDDLLPVAQALWHATVELARASVGKTGARLPVELVQRAVELKQRLMKLAEYYLLDHPVAGPEILSIREGSGHIDLATDLSRLATLHEQYDAIVRRDTKHYRAGDAAAARSTSDEIFTLMGETSDDNHAHWTRIVQRLWTLLLDVYDEVSAAGTWLFRRENAQERFPSLYVAGRNLRRRGGGNNKTAESGGAELEPTIAG